MTGTLDASLLKTPQELAGLPADTSVLLALSGGADSRVLLHLLAKQAREKGFSLLLAHVDHGIRGEGAKRDLAFCRALAKDYGLEICVLEAHVPTLAAAHGRGLEEEAREVRYSFFEKLMKERSIPLLATAHHGDDHLETVLFRLARGTGLQGLGGIAPVRPFANGYLTRPLLPYSRAEILAYCAEQRLAYVTDETNGDPTYARNRVRGQMVPVMESLFAHPQRQVLRMSESLREDEDCLSMLAQDFLKERSDGERLPVTALQTLHPAVRKRVLRQWALQNTGHMPETVHVDALSALLASGNPQAEVALPGGCFATDTDGWLQFLSHSQHPIPPFCLPFGEGSLTVPTGAVEIRVTKGKKEGCTTKINNLSIATHINLNGLSDIIIKNLFWRSRQPGDVIRIGGMHRKLRKQYNTAGISPRMREQMPLLCDGEGILWAPFVGVRDGLSAQGEAYTLEVIFKEISKDF